MATVDGVMPYLRLLDPTPFQIAGRGTVYACALDRTCEGFSHLIGQTVIIQGVGPRVCLGVERFAHCPPWREGEKVGILVEPA